MENQILEIEKKYWKAMEDHDFETVKSLTRFPCITAGKDGVRSIDEPSFRKMFESGANASWKVLDISAVESQVYADSAVIAYQIELERSKEGQSSSMKCACTSTWIKENGSWLCTMHTESDLKE